MAHTGMKVLLLGVGAVTLGVYAVSFLLFTTDDRGDQLDTDVLKSAASAACISLRTSVDALPALPPGATLVMRQDRAVQQQRLVQQLVTEVQQVGDKALDEDKPSREWLSDWSTLAQSRVSYLAGDLTAGYVVPVEQGEPITDRMDAIGVGTCAVPQGLTAAP